MKTDLQKEMTLQEMGLQFYRTKGELDFTRVYHRLKPSIGFYLREMVPELDDRNEVIATTFSKVWDKIDQYDPYWNFSTWVYRIARNEALLFHRSKRRVFSFEGMEEQGINMEKKMVDTFHEDLIFQDDPIDILHEKVIGEIGYLPAIYKTVLTLREIHKKKYDEIAKELGWKHNTVRTRIRKARELVRISLVRKDPELVKKYLFSI